MSVTEIETPPQAGEAPADDAPAAPMAPVAASERLEFLDVLRGSALFGILIANMRGHAAPSALYGNITLHFQGFADRFAQALVDTFVSTKFITLFAFLFGLGFAVQLERARARGVSPGSFYPRRMLALLGFGVLHGALVWWGDILVAYALMGFLLFLFRNARQRTLINWALGGWLVLSTLMSVGAIVSAIQGPAAAPAPDPRRAPAELERIAATYRSLAPVAIVTENFHAWTHYLRKDMSVLFFLPVFLSGLWVWREGIPRDLEGRRGLLARVCRVALPFGLLANTLTTVVHLLRPWPHPLDGLWLVTQLLQLWGTMALSLGYATGLALLFLRPSLRAPLRVFAPVGRMALTNYVMQSVVGLLLFTTTGLYGRVGPAVCLALSVPLFAGQVAFSRWWLARRRFGPLEGLWRRLTYGRAGASAGAA